MVISDAVLTPGILMMLEDGRKEGRVGQVSHSTYRHAPTVLPKLRLHLDKERPTSE